MPPAKRKMDKSPARATEAVTPGGKAKSTVNQRNNRLKKCERFLLHVADMSPELSARWGIDWDEVPEDELAQRDIWAHMADFLSNVYTIEEGAVNAGQHLGLKTAHGDWSGMIDTARKALEATGRPATIVRALPCPVPCVLRSPRARARGHVRSTLRLETRKRALLRCVFGLMALPSYCAASLASIARAASHCLF